MKLWSLITLSIVFLLTLSGCGGAVPTPKDKIVIDSTLPVIELTRNGVIADINSIAFEWNSVSDPRVKGIYVYKNSTNSASGELKYYKTVDSRFKTHFIDTEILPDTKYYYSFVTFSKDTQSKMSQAITVNSLPVLESVSWIHSIAGMPRTAKIIWRPHVNQKVKKYIIERKTLQNKEWKKIDEIEGRLNAEYIDSDLKDNYVYMYRIRVVTFDGITSTPSQSVKIVTKALPKSVNNIKATINLPKSIKLEWDASTQKDFAFYYVYRSENVSGSYKLIATLHNNSYENRVDEDGKIYFYRVSVVDKDGLESIYDRNSIQGMTLPKPQAPTIIKAKHVGLNIEVEWSNSDDRIKVYSLTKKHKKGWFNQEVEHFTNLRDKKHIDKNVELDSTYTYIVYGIDKFGIKSDPSVEVKVVVPESKNIIKVKRKIVEKEVVAPKQIESTDVVVDSDNLDLSEI